MKRRILFSKEQKKAILDRDGHRCVLCGCCAKERKLYIDSILSVELGGKAEIVNGLTLCKLHYTKKKDIQNTETAMEMFMRLFELAMTGGDAELASFCSQILEVYEKNEVNGHIKWNK